MERRGRAFVVPLVLGLCLPGVAIADTFVLARLDCSDAEASANVTSLISAELDFQPGVDQVKEIRTEPSGASCLGSTSCLGALLREGGGQKLVTGTLSASSATYRLDLVYFDGSRVVRRKQFDLPSNPEAVADGMTAVVRDLLTGTTPAKEEASAPSAASFAFDDDEDLDFDEGPSAAERAAAERAAAERAAAEREAEARRVAAAEEARRAEEERRLAEERRRREEAEREAAAEAARRAEAERRSALLAAEDEFDPDAISFTTSTRDIRVESAEEISFARPTDVAVERSSGSSRSLDEALADLDDEDLDLDAPTRVRRYDDDPGYEDLDEDLDRGRPPQRRTEPTPSRSSKPKPANEARHAVGIAARGGYSRFFQLGFVTYGAELQVPLAQTGLYAVGGLEAYSVNRVLPQELAEQLQRTHAWDTIFPFNVGLLYKVDNGGAVVPFFGADAIFGQYYVDPETNGSSWTFGARARLGLDIWVVRSFGFDINAAAGFWRGSQWVVIDQGMKNTGFLPQISGGVVVRF